jgi:hypothetical protein
MYERFIDCTASFCNVVVLIVCISLPGVQVDVFYYIFISLELFFMCYIVGINISSSLFNKPDYDNFYVKGMPIIIRSAFSIVEFFLVIIVLVIKPNNLTAATMEEFVALDGSKYNYYLLFLPFLIGNWGNIASLMKFIGADTEKSNPCLAFLWVSFIILSVVSTLPLMIIDKNFLKNNLVNQKFLLKEMTQCEVGVLYNSTEGYYNYCTPNTIPSNYTLGSKTFLLEWACSDTYNLIKSPKGTHFAFLLNVTDTTTSFISKHICIKDYSGYDLFIDYYKFPKGSRFEYLDPYSLLLSEFIFRVSFDNSILFCSPYFTKDYT